ncbi:MAG: flagellar export protein FliJ [Burkholderiales bacterium]
MPELDAVEILIELAQKASDERARVLGNALRRESSDSERLRLLDDYRKEYLVKYAKLCREGVSATGMLNFQHFLDKLDIAITQQRHALNHSQATAGAARTALGESERKRHSLVALRKRRRASELLIEIRREQKLCDEWTSQRGRVSQSFSGDAD